MHTFIHTHAHARTHTYFVKDSLALQSFASPSLHCSPLHNSVSFIYLRTLVLDILKTVILDFGSQVVVHWVGWESECILRKI